MNRSVFLDIQFVAHEREIRSLPRLQPPPKVPRERPDPGSDAAVKLQAKDC